MTMRITDKCINCGACEWECDVNHAIRKEDLWTRKMDISADCRDCGLCNLAQQKPHHQLSGAAYIIIPPRCTECVGNYGEPRCVAVCPANAIIRDPDRVEGRDDLLAKWRKLHPGQQPVACTC
ncbi:MAG: 4Fe-4S binding protein [Chloroflexi bacterium]|nr:4Fe-4S binding protein [Chloroflexota bacterium]